MKTVRKATVRSPFVFFVAMDRRCHDGDYQIAVSLSRRSASDNGWYGDVVKFRCGDVYRQDWRFHTYVGAQVYGEALLYDAPSRVNAREAKLMSDTLTRLEKCMAKASEEYGRAPHFADMVIRLATIMGIDAIRIHESVYAAIGEALPSWGENGAVDCGIDDGASRLRAFIDTISRMRRGESAKSA